MRRIIQKQREIEEIENSATARKPARKIEREAEKERECGVQLRVREDNKEERLRFFWERKGEGRKGGNLLSEENNTETKRD